MALTEEQLLLQMDILASRTDNNPNMVYKAVAALNKGLDPDVFTSNNTKIVNAINFLASEVNNAANLVTDMNNKNNRILLDVDTMQGKETWNNVQELMGKSTIIEGIENILTGNRQEQLLGLTAEDIGKFLLISQEEDGDLIAKAIEPSLVLEEGNIVLKADDKNISSIPVTEDEDIDNIINGLNQ